MSLTQEDAVAEFAGMPVVVDPAIPDGYFAIGYDVGPGPDRQSWAIARCNADGTVEVVATGEGHPPLSLSP